MLEDNGFTEATLLIEVRAGRVTPKVLACVSAGRQVNCAPPLALLTLTLTLTLTPTLTLTLTPTLTLTLWPTRSCAPAWSK